VDQLRTRLLVRTSHQFSERPIDGDKHSVALVETKPLQQHAVRPFTHSFPDLTDERIETIRTGVPNALEDVHLHLGRVKLFVLVQREALSPA
jgi:hypothetical protein